MNMYKEAAITHLRFPSAKGALAVEDLLSLPLTSSNAGLDLDSIAKVINKALKDSGEESFVEAKSSTSKILQLKLDVLEDIIADRLADRAESEGRVAKKAKKEKLLAALARKEDADLEGKSQEEIQKMLEEL